MRNELIATDMRRGHGCQGCTVVNSGDDFRCEVHVPVQLMMRHRRRRCLINCPVTGVSEPLGLKQLSGHILRRKAGGRRLLRVVVISGGRSAANDLAPPESVALASPPRPATPATPSWVRKRRRLCSTSIASPTYQIGTLVTLFRSLSISYRKLPAFMLKGKLMGRKSEFFGRCVSRSPVGYVGPSGRVTEAPASSTSHMRPFVPEPTPTTGRQKAGLHRMAAQGSRAKGCPLWRCSAVYTDRLNKDGGCQPST